MSILDNPHEIGPLTLKNRLIRSAAFEGMCPDGVPSDSLVSCHRSIAAGGTAMTTSAYVSVEDRGRTFSHQAWMRQEIVPDFKRLTDAVHKEGGLASIQLGHGGNMGDRKVSGRRAVAPSAKLNLFGLNLPAAMTLYEIDCITKKHGESVSMAIDAGFDAVEIHAGHGYLISQFLSPYTNKRKDDYGGGLANRARFLRDVMKEVMRAAGSGTAVIVKTNMDDGFNGGVDSAEAIEIARIIESEGAHALVLSGGFVSKSSFYMMKGKTPHAELIRRQSDPIIKAGMFLFSRLVVREYEYKENYFLEKALKFRDAIKIPLVYVGGIVSRQSVEIALEAGFNFVAIARALIADPDFPKKIEADENHASKCLRCGPCNLCVATMYNGEAKCVYNGD
jgi:2,4-dienoyl-CoA reductase-like NADH-dependent reductase (Old Yellow Enzyme family)